MGLRRDVKGILALLEKIARGEGSTPAVPKQSVSNGGVSKSVKAKKVPASPQGDTTEADPAGVSVKTLADLCRERSKEGVSRHIMQGILREAGASSINNLSPEGRVNAHAQIFELKP